MSNLPTMPPTEQNGHQTFHTWPVANWILLIGSIFTGITGLVTAWRASNKAETNQQNIATVAEKSGKMAEAPNGNWPTTADARELKQIAADPSQVPPSAK